MKISITGSRRGLTPRQRAFVIPLLEQVEWLTHGGCTGVDRDVHALFNTPYSTTVYPGTYEQHKWAVDSRCAITFPVKAPLARNRDIVNATPKLYAFVSTYHEIQRSGTWATIRYARKIGHDVTVVWPDGLV